MLGYQITHCQRSLSLSGANLRRGFVYTRCGLCQPLWFSSPVIRLPTHLIFQQIQQRSSHTLVAWVQYPRAPSVQDLRIAKQCSLSPSEGGSHKFVAWFGILRRSIADRFKPQVLDGKSLARRELRGIWYARSWDPEPFFLWLAVLNLIPWVNCDSMFGHFLPPLVGEESCVCGLLYIYLLIHFGLTVLQSSMYSWQRSSDVAAIRSQHISSLLSLLIWVTTG